MDEAMLRQMSNVLILLPTNSYRAADVLGAARRLDITAIIGSDRAQVLEPLTGGTTLTFSFNEERLPKVVRDAHANAPFSGVVGLDDETVACAARIARWLNLRGSSPDAARDGRSKLRVRQALAAAGIRGPGFRSIHWQDASREASKQTYPCVLKPTFLSASRGVIRTDTPSEFMAAAARIGAILQQSEPPDDLVTESDLLLVEEYLPGKEFALDGYLDDGLQPFLIFEKPDPLEGPFFEETLYLTPPAEPAEVLRALADEVEIAAAALGYTHGPVHAELRLRDGVPTLLEVAPRPIGGLCPRVVPLAKGVHLEEVALRGAMGLPLPALAETRPAGVMMVPIPKAGRLQAVTGKKAALAEPGVEDLVVSIGPGQEVAPLPEGNRYLAFIFATGADTTAVDRTLRRAHAHLHFEIV